MMLFIKAYAESSGGAAGGGRNRRTPRTYNQAVREQAMRQFGLTARQADRFLRNMNPNYRPFTRGRPTHRLNMNNRMAAALAGI